jgi:hypothetical protein
MRTHRGRYVWAGVVFLVMSFGGRVAGQAQPPAGRALTKSGVPLRGQELFALDLGSTSVGEVPAALKLLSGNVEVVLKGGVRMLKAPTASSFLITLPKVLSQDFNLEFDLIPKVGGPPPDLTVEGTPTVNQGPGSAHLLWQADGYLAVIGGAQDNYEQPMPEDLRATMPGRLTHVGLSFEGNTVKLYTNGRRLYTLERQFARGRVLRVSLGGIDAGVGAVYLAQLRIATGAPVVVASSDGAGAGPGGGGGGASGAVLPGAGESGTKLNSDVPGRTGASILNDAPAPTVQVSSLPAGFDVSWSALSNVASYSVCRESPPGSPCVPVDLVNGSYWGGAAPHYGGTELNLYPGTTHAYRVTAYRSDGHFGRSAPVSGTTGEIPPPTDVKIDLDNSTSGHLLLSWKPGLIKDFSWRKITDHQVVGTGMTTAQVVEAPQVEVALSPGVSLHEWKIYSLVHDQKGGWFSSVPATFTYRAAAPADAGGPPATRYRLVALGFKAIQQTNDDILAGDGAGDEVYVAAVVNTTTRKLDVTNITTLTSATHGETGPSGVGPSGRIRAGTAGPSGGLKTGDVFPGNLNQLIAAGGAPTGRTFPLLLWEGALDDAGMIVVHPTLWEEDTGKNIATTWFNRIIAAAYTGYATAGATGISRYASRATIMGLRDQELLGPPLLGMPTAFVVHCTYSVSKDPEGDCTNADRPIGLIGDVYIPYYHDQMLVLTHAAIEKALSHPDLRTGGSPGVIVMSLIDVGTYAVGGYELYLKVERMP